MKFPVLLLLASAMITMSYMSIRQENSSSGFDQAAAIEAVREFIGERGDAPAEEVFENIEVLKGFPAKRLVAVMEFGFSKSLGVDCTHCHDENNWASEEKLTKQIARDMWDMVGTINREALAAIPNLGSDVAFVNCTTCHRGEVIPSTSLDGSP